MPTAPALPMRKCIHVVMNLPWSLTASGIPGLRPTQGQVSHFLPHHSQCWARAWDTEGWDPWCMTKPSVSPQSYPQSGQVWTLSFWSDLFQSSSHPFSTGNSRTQYVPGGCLNYMTNGFPQRTVIRGSCLFSFSFSWDPNYFRVNRRRIDGLMWT